MSLAERNRENREKRKEAERKAAEQKNQKTAVPTATPPSSGSSDGNHDDLPEILNLIDVSDLNHNEWMKCGTALKKSGISFEVFDAWSSRDTRQGEYQGRQHTLNQWNSFDVNNDVTSGYIVTLAEKYGYQKPERSNPGLSQDNSGNVSSPEGAEDKEDEFEPEWVTGNELLEVADDNPEWLLRGVYAREDVVLITGLSGLGKTHLVMEIAMAHATGGEVLGRTAAKARTLVIDPEMKSSGLARRLRQVSKHYGATADDLEMLQYFCTRVAPKNLKSIDNFLTLLEKSEDYECPDLLILDSISVITAVEDLDENSNPDVTKFLTRVKQLAERHNCAVLMMHHSGKNAGMAYRNSGTLARGAESWRAGSDNVFELIPLKIEEGSGAWELANLYQWTSVDEYGENVTRYPRAVRLQCTKFRYEDMPHRVNMLFKPPIHIVDPTRSRTERGELDECKPAFDRPSDKGGERKRENEFERRVTEEEAIESIVYNLESEGTIPDSETVAKLLNQWRKENGNNRAVSAETLERYCTEGKKRKYFKVECVDGVFEVVADECETEDPFEPLDVLDGTKLALSMDD